MAILRFYQTPALSESACRGKLATVNGALGNVAAESLVTEYCYYVQLHGQAALNKEQQERLIWLLTPGFSVLVAEESTLKKSSSTAAELLVEIGPRLNFSTPSSTQSVAICQTIGLECVNRIERSTRYLISFNKNLSPHPENVQQKVGIALKRYSF